MGIVKETLLSRAGSKPAPGDLLLVQLFINTWDMDSKGGKDYISTPEEFRSWLIDTDLLDRKARVTASDVETAARVREALRALALANNGGAADANALETLNRAARSAQLAVHFDGAGSGSLEPLAPGVDGALGRILAIAFNAMNDGSWRRLKACPAEHCEFAFFDETKNRSGTWCSMSVCGNRAKARSFRKRHVTADHAH
jgi:predicted RNA-binding Zn ribbon-like protein